VGLALAAGGARGAAHTGVIKVLCREGIPIDCIAGSSIGAVVGGAHAAGVPAERVEKAWQETDLAKVVRAFFPTLTRSGISSGAEKRRILADVLGDNPRIEDLPIPFAAVACDLHRGVPVTLTSGPLLDAVQASASIPGVFRPVRIGDRVLVDGGLVSPLPIEACRDLGADVVIAVDILPAPHRDPAGDATVWDRVGERLRDTFREQHWLPGNLPNLLAELFDPKSEERALPGLTSIVSQSILILQRRILALELKQCPPDLVLLPLISYSPMGYLHASDGIRAGEKAVDVALPAIRKLVAAPAGR
jgi:NTE family protein